MSFTELFFKMKVIGMAIVTGLVIVVLLIAAAMDLRDLIKRRKHKND